MYSAARVTVLLGKQASLWNTTRGIGAASADLLWSPGLKGNASTVMRLARTIQERTSQNTECITIGAKGQPSIANALRALALATRAGAHTVEFQVKWKLDGADNVLHFEAAYGTEYREFRGIQWDDVAPLLVSAATQVAPLARAIASERRNNKRCVVKARVGHIDRAGDQRGSALAKALASAHRYSVTGLEPWCVATHAAGDILTVHMAGDGQHVAYEDQT